KMKKTINISFAAALLMAFCVSCQNPEYVEPTVIRQGITSLTAYFTSGKFVDKELAKLVVTDETTDRYVIPIPYYYPEESDNSTTIYMSAVRVRAELAENCKIDPPLTILDLNEENEFTFTNALGESHNIIITGKRTKSDKCTIQSFKLTEPTQMEGFVFEQTKEIWLFSIEDLDGYSASAVPCAHATIEEDLSQPRNYNEPQPVTVVAHNGDKCVYTVIKKNPEKITYGFRPESVTPLFNIEPVTRVGFPAYTEDVCPSMAMLGGNLVVCFGNGEDPVIMDGLTGSKIGSLSLPGLNAAAITNDAAGNLLIVNHAMDQETVNIYKMSPSDESPALLHSFLNETDVPVGHVIRANGDISADAVIILTHEGITGVTETSKYYHIEITGGAVASTTLVDLSSLGLSWGPSPTGYAKVVPASSKVSDGVFLSYYSANTLTYINGNGNIAAQYANPAANGNFNSNNLDCKEFNNAVYLAYLVTSHFPMWGCGPMLYIYDVTSPTSIKEGMPVLSNDSIEWYQIAAQGTAAGDVLIAPSADGFNMFVYYFDHNCGVIGGYSADCVQL
ncbi:MAG: DUF5018 domain-containing protein, partial [Candidatus Cryptobacteroides sp.]